MAARTLAGKGLGIMYTYGQLLDDAGYLNFCGMQTGIIGYSEAGNAIPYFFCGEKNGPQIIVTGGIHARENVSASLVTRQAFCLFKSATKLSGGVYFVPMVNVDGALLMEKGADFFKERRDFLLSLNSESHDFSLWKANINGVDLNTNFDACFGTGVSNIDHPAPSDYTGRLPFDQSETRCLRDFTNNVRPTATVSYHALGREIYWYFGQEKHLKRDEKIARIIANQLGYKKIDGTLGSAGGYKDWCIQKLGIVSLTIELGHDGLTHPLKESDIEEDFKLNKKLPQLLLEQL